MQANWRSRSDVHGHAMADLPSAPSEEGAGGVVQECARYLETFKAYESKPAALSQGRADEVHPWLPPAPSSLSSNEM